MPLASTPSASHTQNSVPIVDMTHLNTDTQSQILHRMEEQNRLEHAVDMRVFLLRGRMEDVLNQMANLEEGMFDIDGTLTGIGNRKLYRRNVEQLLQLQRTDLETTAITGRHYYQVDGLWKEHADGTGLNNWYIEQGFYKTAPDTTPQYFIGTPELEQTVDGVRKRIADRLPGIGGTHGLEFITTSLEGFAAAHQSMVSFDAHHVHNHKKIEDARLHDRLMAELKQMWLEIDPQEAEAKTGTSSIGTYEWTMDGLHKGVALKAHMEVTGRDPKRIGIFGDSGNDTDMFRVPGGLLKGVIIGEHTKLPLIQQAQIATIGLGNSTPILKLMNQVRGKI